MSEDRYANVPELFDANNIESCLIQIRMLQDENKSLTDVLEKAERTVRAWERWRSHGGEQSLNILRAEMYSLEKALQEIRKKHGE